VKNAVWLTAPANVPVTPVLAVRMVYLREGG
jgi:hypothetical protein